MDRWFGGYGNRYSESADLWIGGSAIRAPEHRGIRTHPGAATPAVGDVRTLCPLCHSTFIMVYGVFPMFRSRGMHTYINKTGLASAGLGSSSLPPYVAEQLNALWRLHRAGNLRWGHAYLIFFCCNLLMSSRPTRKQINKMKSGCITETMVLLNLQSSWICVQIRRCFFGKHDRAVYSPMQCMPPIYLVTEIVITCFVHQCVRAELLNVQSVRIYDARSTQFVSIIRCVAYSRRNVVAIEIGIPDNKTVAHAGTSRVYDEHFDGGKIGICS